MSSWLSCALCCPPWPRRPPESCPRIGDLLHVWVALCTPGLTPCLALLALLHPGMHAGASPAHHRAIHRAKPVPSVQHGQEGRTAAGAPLHKAPARIAWDSAAPTAPEGTPNLALVVASPQPQDPRLSRPGQSLPARSPADGLGRGVLHRESSCGLGADVSI